MREILEAMKGLEAKPGQVKQLLLSLKGASSDQIQQMLGMSLFEKLVKIEDLSQLNVSELFRATRAQYGTLGSVLCGSHHSFDSLVEFCRGFGIELDNWKLNRSALVSLREMSLLRSPQTFNFTKVQLSKLFGRKPVYGKCEKEIFAKGIEQGLALCPPELVFYLLAQTNFNSGGYVAHEPIGKHHLIASFKSNKEICFGPWLESESHNGYQDHAEFVFVVPK